MVTTGILPEEIWGEATLEEMLRLAKLLGFKDDAKAYTEALARIEEKRKNA